ncbi:MAG: RNA polymerase sigma factor [Actinomycetota bacterium]|nr:RNA polymerase sigma factor [Actinomycetota bacterium]
MTRHRGDRSGSGRGVVPLGLVERCKGGDEAAWAELVDLTHREVYTLCLRILDDPSDAAEATQDAYLKAWRGLKSFRGDAQFTTWLYRVASNAAISKHRSRKRRRLYEVGAEDELLSAMAAPGSVETTAEIRRDVLDVEAAIRDLPDHYRSAVVLRDVYGLSIEEIAGELSITETAAKVRVHRGRKKLKETLYPTGEQS